MRSFPLLAAVGFVLSPISGRAEWGYPSVVATNQTGPSAPSPYLYTGLVGTDDASGSGSVAVHPRLVLGCAHVNTDMNDVWLPQGSIRWFWKWNEGDYPDDSDGILLTGYFYFSSYSSAVARFGGASPRAFMQDFVANYSATQDTAGGEAAPWVDDGKRALISGNLSKRITGYPAGRYDYGDPLEYRMHETDFDDDMEVDRDNYLGLDWVETGAGNSGGPVWVWLDGEWALAGVLVSGLEWYYDGWSSIGVCSLNRAGWGLITSALRQVGSASDYFTQTFSAGSLPAKLPDRGTVSRNFTVTGLAGAIQQVKLTLAATHARGGDISVTLRGPAGKTITVVKPVSLSKSSAPNLTLTAQDVKGFQNLFANGTWTLVLRDNFANLTGSLQSASLQITTR